MHIVLQFPQGSLVHKFFRKPEALILLVSIWLVFACNIGFWKVVAANNPTGDIAATSVYFVSVLILTIGLLSLAMLILAVGTATRAVLALALVVGSATGYYTANYGILFDPGMLVNVIETNRAEAFELLNPTLIAVVVLLGLIPAIAVWRYPLARRRLSVAVLERGIAFVLALALIAAPLMLSQKEIFSLARNHREIRHMIAPLNVISAGYVLTRDALETTTEFRSVGLDAVRTSAVQSDDRPAVHVLIVGETARAASFSLDGYSRNTNPALARQANVDFREAVSCGTATAISLPCMFSAERRKDFQRATSDYEDNLLDIASRAGYDVQWIDNGNGCKGVCARVDHRDLHLSDVDSICVAGECYDEILVHELRRLLANVKNDTLIVLHQLGSHGPAYYRRYPESFRVFYPDCVSPNLGDCTNAEITNSYDNTIVYTDHIVSSAIDALSAESDRINASLIYMSDHGESLGEHNLYLHGMPYQFAPDEQTRIPMVIWFSESSRQDDGPQPFCAGQDQQAAVSHDNLFHTELGLLGIQTAVYEPALDLYSSCRVPRRMAAIGVAADQT